MKKVVRNPFPISPIFYWNYNSTAELCINQGGTSSGKTYSILQVLVMRAIEGRYKILVVGQDMPNLKIGPIADFEEIIRNPQIASCITKMNATDKKYTFFTGSTIQFKSVKDAQDAKSGKRHILFVNEANGIPYKNFDELFVRTEVQTFIDYNPNASFWAHDLHHKDNVDLFISNYTHNPFLSERIKRKILKYKETDPVKWEVYGLGKTGQVEGVVFKNVRWIDSFPDNCKRVSYGMDFGYSHDPTALVKTGWLHGQLFIELMLYDYQLTAADLAEKIRALNLDRYTPINCDSSDPRLIEELRRKGVNAKPVQKTRIETGINKLHEQMLNIVANKHFREEQLHYTYKYNSRTGKYLNQPTDDYNHAWDATRYSIMEETRRRGVLATKRIK